MHQPLVPLSLHAYLGAGVGEGVLHLSLHALRLVPLCVLFGSTAEHWRRVSLPLHTYTGQPAFVHVSFDEYSPCVSSTHQPLVPLSLHAYFGAGVGEGVLHASSQALRLVACEAFGSAATH